MAITLTLLGTGTSTGIPMIGCDCRVCTSTDPRDYRERAAAMVQYPDPDNQPRTYLIDTTPDLRMQMIRNHVMRIDGVLYTHNHADHVFGLDDLRRFNQVMEAPVDIYAEPRMIDWLRQTFRYVFDIDANINKSFVPALIPQPIEPSQPLTLSGRSWLPIRLLHGRLPVLGFRIADVAYCTDVSKIPPESYAQLADLDVLVLDALRYRHHPTHLTIDQALEIIDHLKPRRAYLTHLTHDIKHSELEAHLPDHVFVGQDGLTIESDA